MSKIWRLVGSLILLAVIAWRLDWSQVSASFAHLNVTLWWLAVVVYLAAQVMPRWMERLREIHDELASHRIRLEQRYRELKEAYADDREALAKLKKTLTPVQVARAEAMAATAREQRP